LKGFKVYGIVVCASGYNIVALGEAQCQGVLPSVEITNKIFYFSLILGDYQLGMTKKRKDGHFEKSRAFHFLKCPWIFYALQAHLQIQFLKKTRKKNEQIFRVMQRFFPVPNECFQ
jgi:hypothetical protein